MLYEFYGVIFSLVSISKFKFFSRLHHESRKRSHFEASHIVISRGSIIPTLCWKAAATTTIPSICRYIRYYMYKVFPVVGGSAHTSVFWYLYINFQKTVFGCPRSGSLSTFDDIFACSLTFWVKKLWKYNLLSHGLSQGFPNFSDKF